MRDVKPRRLSIKRLGLILATIGVASCALGPEHANVDALAEAVTYVFVCSDQSQFVAKVGPNLAWVFGDERTLRLLHVVGSSPSRFASDGNELIVDRQQGTLLRPGTAPVTCTNDPQQAIWEHAKLDGVDFRAMGNEPPWVLEIRKHADIVFITGYERQRFERHLPQAVIDTEAQSTTWDASDLRIVATAAPCHDSMSGAAFESTVTIRWQGRELRGCGRTLY